MRTPNFSAHFFEEIFSEESLELSDILLYYYNIEPVFSRQKREWRQYLSPTRDSGEPDSDASSKEQFLLLPTREDKLLIIS